MKSILTKDQKIKKTRFFTEDGGSYKIEVTARYDDECGNGHNSFALTCWIWQQSENGRWIDSGGGADHEAIAKHFPEWAHLIKWHLVSSDEPMHYAANAIYLAGDRDCHGLKKGEPRNYDTAIYFGDFPIHFMPEAGFTKWLRLRQANLGMAAFRTLKLRAIPHKNDKNESYKFADKWTFEGFADEWYQCPFDTETQAKEFKEALNRYGVAFVDIPTSWGEGKPRELDAARRAAIWPEATDEELTAPGLEERLAARLPALMAAFRADMEAIGFIW